MNERISFTKSTADMINQEFFKEHEKISNIAKYTVKSRFPGNKTAPLAVSFEYSL